MIVMIMMMAPISQRRDHGATVGKTSSEQTIGLGRQEMMEHRPGDFDGLDDDALLAFDGNLNLGPMGPALKNFIIQILIFLV